MFEQWYHTRKEFNYLCHIRMKEKCKLLIDVYVSAENVARKGICGIKSLPETL